ncbi:MAG TPA: hypothetical protein VJ809_06650 [Pirellulales bacterium]|jgi:hypothetical protein|nr:hypothetical protein [Pirellulales bacterium]
MIRFIAHFDGQHLSPDEPVDLPKGTPLQVTVETVRHYSQEQRVELKSFFDELEAKVGLIDNKPADWALRHDHYLTEDACSDHRDE